MSNRKILMNKVRILSRRETLMKPQVMYHHLHNHIIRHTRQLYQVLLSLNSYQKMINQLKMINKAKKIHKMFMSSLMKILN